MADTIFTAKLRNGLDGIQLIRDEINFIAFNDIIEVKGSGGNVITQPAIAGSESAVIDRVIAFEVTSPNNISFTKIGFFFNTTSSKWEGLSGISSGVPVAASVNLTGYTDSFSSIIVKVSVGQASKYPGSTGGMIFASPTYVTIPVEIIYDYEVGLISPTTKPVVDLRYFKAETDPITKTTVYTQELLQGRYTNIQLFASNNPAYWKAKNLPIGLYLENKYTDIADPNQWLQSGLIKGTPTEPGVFISTFSASTIHYNHNYPQHFSKEVQVKFNVLYNEEYVNGGGGGGDGGGGGGIDAVDENGLPIFLENDGVDLFFDIQSRALMLTLPKQEAIIASDTKVINTLEAEKLLVKTGETLWLNVRFVKGATPLDPMASGLRFGVAGKIGGPLLMEGDTFTKVGSGSSAYYRMRVTPIENEFSAIISDYYDDDAVEQISSANENQASSNGDVEGVCELALTTGSGETIAEIKSDTLGVVLKRSIF